MNVAELRETFEDIIRRLNEPKLGNPKYGMDRRAVEGELRSVARAAIAALEAAPVADEAGLRDEAIRDIDAALDASVTGGQMLRRARLALSTLEALARPAPAKVTLDCYECALYSGTDKAPPPHDHPDRQADLVNAARVYANVVEERYHGRTGWASVAEARSLLLSAIDLAALTPEPPQGQDR